MGVRRRVANHRVASNRRRTPRDRFTERHGLLLRQLKALAEAELRTLNLELRTSNPRNFELSNPRTLEPSNFRTLEPPNPRTFEPSSASVRPRVTYKEDDRVSSFLVPVVPDVPVIFRSIGVVAMVVTNAITTSIVNSVGEMTPSSRPTLSTMSCMR